MFEKKKKPLVQFSSPSISFFFLILKWNVSISELQLGGDVGEEKERDKDFFQST